MTVPPRPNKLRAILSESGSASLEFVILFPFIFGIFLTSVDFSMQMLRQISLDRGVDVAMRNLRLGRDEYGLKDFEEDICRHVKLVPSCARDLTVELRPIEPHELANIDRSVQCVNRAEDIRPVVEFKPGNQEQELMMVRVCAVANPFITANGLLLGNPRGPNDDFMSVSVAVFVNEPSR